MAGAIVSVLAFPPFGPGWLIVVGIALFLSGLGRAENRTQGLLLGAVYGLGFFGGLMWWLSELELIALILVPAQAAYLAAYGWWLARHNDRSPGVWLTLAVGGWALMETLRYRFPVGGLEWGAAGYALSDSSVTRFGASTIGASGLTVLVVLIAAVLVQVARRRTDVGTWLGAGLALLLLVTSTVAHLLIRVDDFEPVETVAVVQGSTPCPFEHCPPNERLRTFEQHLELTKTIEPGSAGFVVWSEGSTGSTNADPVQNPEVGEAISAEARRIGAWFLVGSDRPLNDREWVNANVVFNPDGEIIGEYRKQHPVPFGEYIPLRPLFDWIPALDRVPRDQIPGDGPVVFDLGAFRLGSVISFEGGFSRYPLQHGRASAEVLVVATNEASYGLTPASDQFIGMTRMRAVELGVPVIHAAVTGKSTVVEPSGEIDQLTGLATEEVLYQQIGRDVETPYTTIGDLVLYLAALAGVFMWWRTRALVGSGDRSFEKE